MSDFALTLWTDDPVLAAAADRAGVDRIGLDLETLGKRERQAGLGTRISAHDPADLTTVGARLREARLFARLDPLHSGTARQLDHALSAGVRVVMLPMFRERAEVAEFIALVGGRAEVVLLLETAEALYAAAEIAALDGVGEIHLGINDLSLALGLDSRFATFVDDRVGTAAAAITAAGANLGIGGIGRVGDRSLPIDPDLIYAQYPRLGATRALLSRAFVAGATDLCAEVARSRGRLREWFAADAGALAAARAELERAIATSQSW